ncbi:hypothetical protein [Novosphingobium sp.]|uniref:hypothetical protein n=1 Tax=Novosphingobium sp. TaxID=1874826 RepID=UPI0011AB8BE8|nr:hypothetical protein [Novosphingobium sp.]
MLRCFSAWAGTSTSGESYPMGLFKPDLFRSLALGFLLGAAVMAVTAGTTALATPDAETTLTHTVAD